MLPAYLSFGIAAAASATLILTELPFVRDWWQARRARRTTIPARTPETRRATTYEHPPARCAAHQGERVMAPATWSDTEEVAGAEGVAR